MVILYVSGSKYNRFSSKALSLSLVRRITCKLLALKVLFVPSTPSQHWLKWNIRFGVKTFLQIWKHQGFIQLHSFRLQLTGNEQGERIFRFVLKWSKTAQYVSNVYKRNIVHFEYSTCTNNTILPKLKWRSVILAPDPPCF